MSRLLISEPALILLPSLAKAIGLNEAIMLQQIQYWISYPKAIEREGTRWHYDTYDAWHVQFPFWCTKTIKRTALSLEKKKLVIVKQFNKLKGDRTKWYTINYKALDKITDKIDKSLKEKENITPSGQIVPMTPPMGTICPDHGDKLSPSYSTETTTETTSIKQQQTNTRGDQVTKAKKDVVVILEDELRSMNVSQKKIHQMLRDHGREYVQKKLNEMKSMQNEPRSRAAMLCWAIDNDKTLSADPTKPKAPRSHETPEETHAKLLANESKSKKPKDRAKAAQHIKGLKDITTLGKALIESNRKLKTGKLLSTG